MNIEAQQARTIESFELFYPIIQKSETLSRRAHFKERSFEWERVSPVIPDNGTRTGWLGPDDWGIWLLFYCQINHRIALGRVHHLGKAQIDVIIVSSGGCVMLFRLFSLQLLQLLFRCDKKLTMFTLAGIIRFYTPMFLFKRDATYNNLISHFLFLLLCSHTCYSIYSISLSCCVTRVIIVLNWQENVHHLHISRAGLGSSSERQSPLTLLRPTSIFWER